ncbi:hypothetical protein T484DRAFT_1937756 [Baffinella frigidus]|nr:hypothetical protein T484DRAFT_1937756 [Cryptophyta sp. CCMP2293]
MVQSTETLHGAYGTIPAPASRSAAAQLTLRNVGPKVVAVLALAVIAVACVAGFSGQAGSVMLESDGSMASVADAILQSSGDGLKDGSHIPASIAALAAQAAREKETGRLSATVELPEISKKMAKEAAEAKHEIQIEHHVDYAKKAAKRAAKMLALKATRASKKAEKEHLHEVRKEEHKESRAKLHANEKKIMLMHKEKMAVEAKAKLAHKSKGKDVCSACGVDAICHKVCAKAEAVRMAKAAKAAAH